MRSVVRLTGVGKAPASQQETASIRVRAATLRDVPALERFIASFTTDGTLLPRTRSNMLAHLRDFRVVRAGGAIIGCGALQLVNARLAEVRSVAVHPDWRGAGLGSRIVESLLADAARLGVTQVFCLTRRQSFFSRLGFAAVPKEDFPHKIWNDCRVCPRLTCCDEIAMQRQVRAALGGQATPPRATAQAAASAAAVEVLPSRKGGAIEVHRPRASTDQVPPAVPATETGIVRLLPPRRWRRR
jgi:amino-acid N-acetyltransferase